VTGAAAPAVFAPVGAPIAGVTMGRTAVDGGSLDGPSDAERARGESNRPAETVHRFAGRDLDVEDVAYLDATIGRVRDDHLPVGLVAALD